MFITSNVIGNYQQNLNYMHRSLGIKGVVFGIEQLLYMSDSIKDNKLSHTDFFDFVLKN